MLLDLSSKSCNYIHCINIWERFMFIPTPMCTHISMYNRVIVSIYMFSELRRIFRSCSKLHSYKNIMYTIHLIKTIHIIKVFEFFSKCTLTPTFVTFVIIFIKTKFINIEQIWFINPIFDVLMLMVINGITLSSHILYLSYFRIYSTACCNIPLNSFSRIFLNDVLMLMVINGISLSSHL